MICKTKRSGSVPTAASTTSRRTRRARRGLLLAALLALVRPVSADPVDPEIGRLLERALTSAEQFRQELPKIQYEARMRVQEWNGSGHLRGAANATAIFRPGDARPLIYLSREVRGKVRLPDDKPEKDDENDKDVTLQEFAREHRIAERFAFEITSTETIAGERARRVSFTPKPNQPEKNTADRFLDAISGTAWVSEDEGKLVKFDLRLSQPFQLLWIFAALKELSIQYELITPGEILGHARLKVVFAFATPIYSIRQQHEVDLDKFRKREPLAAP